jgi:hypothetical protein
LAKGREVTSLGQFGIGRKHKKRDIHRQTLHAFPGLPPFEIYGTANCETDYITLFLTECETCGSKFCA